MSSIQEVLVLKLELKVAEEGLVGLTLKRWLPAADLIDLTEGRMLSVSLCDGLRESV